MNFCLLSIHIRPECVNLINILWIYQISLKTCIKHPNKMHLSVCIYSKICTLHVSDVYNVHHQEFSLSLYIISHS